MFEKIGRYAETVATSASQSRRGFLGRLGQVALGVAGLVGGLFVLPSEAGNVKPSCTFACPDGSHVETKCPCGSFITVKGMTCLRVESTCY